MGYLEINRKNIVKMYHGIQGSTPHIKERGILSLVLHEHIAENKKVKLLRRGGGLLNLKLNRKFMKME